MTITTDMLATHPTASTDIDQDVLSRCIEACIDCAQACGMCADACLAEEMVADLRSCIRTDLDCADICTTTARVVSRRTGANADIIKAVVTACAAACKSCGDECAGHASMHEHCKVCANACRRCEQACNDLLAAMN